MTRQQYVAWQDASPLHRVFDLHKLVDDGTGLIMEFHSAIDSQSVKVHFVSPLSYRSSDEGDRIESLSSLSSLAVGDVFILQVKNSEYIDWLVKESCGVRNRDEMKHFIFVTRDDIIDVIATVDPEIFVT